MNYTEVANAFINLKARQTYRKGTTSASAYNRGTEFMAVLSVGGQVIARINKATLEVNGTNPLNGTVEGLLNALPTPHTFRYVGKQWFLDEVPMKKGWVKIL